ncbi:MAG: ParB/RepB/Spo0J family partition protein [Gemmataceae bacterium]
MSNQLKIENIIVGPRHRQDLGDIAALAKSIRDVGLLHPVVVSQDNHLIAGRRRLAAVKELGLQEIPVHFVRGLDDALLHLRAERDENMCRKDFTPSEAVAIGLALEELEKPRAAKRQAQAGPKEGRGKKRATAPGNLPAPLVPEEGILPAAEPAGVNDTGRVRDRVADAVGISPRTYEKAKTVVAAAEQNPEQFGAVKEEMDRTGKVDPAFKKVRERRGAVAPGKAQENKTSSAEKEPARKSAKQGRTKEEIAQSWQRQPNEGTEDWFGRLKKVTDKDKKGQKHLFTATLEQAIRLLHFNLDEELFHLVCVLQLARDNRWPMEYHAEFGRMVRKAADEIDEDFSEKEKA